MKAFKLEILIVDHEGFGQDDIINAVANLRHYYPSVLSVKGAEVGEWSDDHPLNKFDTQKAAIEEYFPS